MEKRHFTRADFTTGGTIRRGTRQIPCVLVDLSLKGALVTVEDPDLVELNKLFEITIPLPGSDIAIKTSSECVHKESNYLGFRFHSIDAESMTHLRRLLELNTGWVDEISSELSFLVDLESNEGDKE